ncbi:MAG: glucokinase [Gammaproteobacteria bacterium]|nr:glucokinase [Gammaproteobacteria bacterium]
MLPPMGWLIADIGGTTTHCAIARPGGTVDSVETFRNRDFPGLDRLLAAYLGVRPPGQRPDEAVIAIAAPIRGDEVRMVNINWAFSLSALARTLSLKRLIPLNDFAAQAYALPVLGPGDLQQVGGGKAVCGAPKVVVGPGTGLGTAGLVSIAGRWHAITGEGGHVTMAPSDEREARIIALGRERFGHCSAERLISGAGLAFVHSALSGAAALAPAEVGARIAAGDATALEALDVFFQLLGTVASNLALTFAAFGGVYIGGGITPRYVEQFKTSGFRPRFEDKGRYRPFLADIPTWVITADEPALRGLAAYAEAQT